MKLYHFVKRIVDIIVSLTGILLLSFFFIFAALWIKACSKGPVVYTHERIGKGKKPFAVYKFRSMVVGARNMQKKGLPDSKLITPAGHFLRRTFLDEMPQLFNILKGEMSLIGPRPIDAEVFKKFSKQDKKGMEKIVELKPGISSLSSVVFKIPKDKWGRLESRFPGITKVKNNDSIRIFLDYYYIENESFLLDSWIFIYSVFLSLKNLFFKPNLDYY